jgi:hypothetical protein
VPGSSESKIDFFTGHEGIPPVKMYRNRKKQHNNTGAGSLNTEVTEHLGVLSTIDIPTGHEGGRPVEMYRNREAVSLEQYSNN